MPIEELVVVSWHVVQSDCFFSLPLSDWRTGSKRDRYYETQTSLRRIDIAIPREGAIDSMSETIPCKYKE